MFMTKTAKRRKARKRSGRKGAPSVTRIVLRAAFEKVSLGSTTAAEEGRAART